MQISLQSGKLTTLGGDSVGNGFQERIAAYHWQKFHFENYLVMTDCTLVFVCPYAPGRFGNTIAVLVRDKFKRYFYFTLWQSQ
jgi:hypothetical protein